MTFIAGIRSMRKVILYLFVIMKLKDESEWIYKKRGMRVNENSHKGDAWHRKSSIASLETS